MMGVGLSEKFETKLLIRLVHLNPEESIHH